MLLAGLMLQVAAGPVLADPRGCRPAQPDEVVVCARRGDSPYRLEPLVPPPPPPAIKPLRNPLAFILPGGGTVGVHAVQSNLESAKGQGLALTLAIPLGRTAKR